MIKQVATGSLVTDKSVTIANGVQVSSVIDQSSMTLIGVKVPSAFTGTTITFQMCDTSGGTYVDVYNSAGQVSYTVAPSRYVAINPADLQGCAFLKIKSGTAEGAARTLTCSMKGI